MPATFCCLLLAWIGKEDRWTDGQWMETDQVGQWVGGGGTVVGDVVMVVVVHGTFWVFIPRPQHTPLGTPLASSLLYRLLPLCARTLLPHTPIPLPSTCCPSPTHCTLEGRHAHKTTPRGWQRRHTWGQVCGRPPHATLYLPWHVFSCFLLL